MQENPITFRPIGPEDYPVFHQLLNDYYREGEDAQTPQAEIDGFISYLHDLCLQGRICGAIVHASEPVGFVLWKIDDGSEFSNLEGFGTILEIGLAPDRRLNGTGWKIVAFAEREMQQLGATGFYVCAYGPAKAFWTKCGYQPSGKQAENGLDIYWKI